MLRVSFCSSHCRTRLYYVCVGAAVFRLRSFLCFVCVTCFPCVTLALASFSAAAQHTHTHTHAHHTYTHTRARTPPAPAAGHHALASTLSLPIDSLTAAASPRCCHAPTHPPPAFALAALVPLLFSDKAPGAPSRRRAQALLSPTRQTTPRAATFARCQIDAHASPLLAPTHHLLSPPSCCCPCFFWRKHRDGAPVAAHAR